MNSVLCITRPDGVAGCLQSEMSWPMRPQQRTLWMLNLICGCYIFVVILALINRSIKTTITKVFKSVVQVIYTWIMLRTNTDSC